VDTAIYQAVIDPESKNQAFVAKIDETVTGVFVISKDVNLQYYKSHFHIQDNILLSEHERKGHTRLIYSVINPIFIKATRFCLKELLRLTAKSCLYFEIGNKTVLPTIFDELITVRSRRFPHFLNKKWNHERNVYDETEDEPRDYQDGADRDPLDEEESTFALSFITRRLLSEPKIIKNSRIVVVGGSDTGISFIEALLSISYLKFSNIVFISPGGLPNNHFDDKKSNLKAYSTSYTHDELKRLMLENRITVINARMIDIDRGDKNIVLHNNKIIPYDTLILTMGLQEKTLSTINFVSRGITTQPEGKQRMEGVMSIDDPYLYQHLRVGGTLMNSLTYRKKPEKAVIYGRSINCYCCIQGLIERGVKPHNISLVIPKRESHVSEGYNDEDHREMELDMPVINPDAFEDEDIESKVQAMVTDLGVKIYRDCHINSLTEDDNNNLKVSVHFKKLDQMDAEEEEEEEEYMDRSDEGEGDENEGEDGFMTASQKRKKKNELDLNCKVFITAGHKDVDPDVFNAIHNNGLVYNGRLIVDKNF